MSSVEPGTRSEITPVPGATTSGGRFASREEKSATVSSAVSAVPAVSDAPTAITNGSAAGRSSRPVPSAWLPAAATTVTPRCHSCSAA